MVLSLTGCHSEATRNRDIVGFLKTHLNEILILVFLCHYKLADQHIQSAHFDQLPHLSRIPIQALVNLDPLLEGILREERSINTSLLVPRSFSDLVRTMLKVDEDNQIDFNEISKMIRKSLQTDMFALDECSKKKVGLTSR